MDANSSGRGIQGRPGSGARARSDTQRGPGAGARYRATRGTAAPSVIAFFTGSTQFEVPLGTISAASVVVTVPLILLVVLFQRRIVSGLTSGAVKG